MPGAMVKESEIDELFQLPLSEFTAARNALAKAAGKDGAAIRALTKPPLAAWAVNQLYWKDPETYERLIAAASEMRQAHKAVIEGRQADLRSAGREHDIAIETALKATLSILTDAGHPVTDATRQAVTNTLRALPSDEPPGRLTRTLSPGGFEMLAGVTPAALPKGASKPATREIPKRGGRDEDRAAREAAKKREERAAAERAVRDADQKARHAEFEAARAARAAAKAARRLEEAQRAFDEARLELEEAEREAEHAEAAKTDADKRVREAQGVLEAARKRLERQTS